jgi:hypothetical protein
MGRLGKGKISIAQVRKLLGESVRINPQLSELSS